MVGVLALLGCRQLPKVCDETSTEISSGGVVVLNTRVAVYNMAYSYLTYWSVLGT